MIWGVGYGVATQAFKAKGYLVKDGVPNIDVYGDFLPISRWKSESGVLSLSDFCYFDTAINKNGHTQLIFSNVVIGGVTGQINIGTTSKGYNLYQQKTDTNTTYKEIKIDISDFPSQFYLTFGPLSYKTTFPFSVDSITLL